MKIYLLLLGFFLIGGVFAMYSGQSIYVDLTNEIQNLKSVNCSISNSTYDLEGLNFTFNNTGYLISTLPNYKPDNLTIICLLNGQKYVSSGGGGTYSNKKIIKKTYPNYICGEWSECSELGQSRKCFISGNSSKEVIYPTWKSCDYKEKEILKENNTEKNGEIVIKIKENFLIKIWNWIKDLFKWIF